MPHSFLDELNESQRQAVEYCDGPALVIAGAGSGKTRVLTYKIAHLLSLGMEPWRILALTFTNKAAREMKERIARLVRPELASQLWMGTFHSVFARILRNEIHHLGYPSDFTIYDTADSRSLIKTIVKDMELDDKTYRPAMLQNRISMAKNQLITPEQYEQSKESYEQDTRENIPLFREVYKRYTERCRLASAMDFDDLLIHTYFLFERNPEVCEKYRQRFRYILVDEYQDTNFAQHRIVVQLAQGGQAPVCAVGDDAQSIYSFRGAKIDNILSFSRLFPNAQIFKLEQNYRSTQTIVRAAGSLIEKNREQIPKNVYSEKEKGDLIDVFQAYSDTEEGEIVSNKLQDLRRRSACSYGDFAILYRTNAQSRIFEEAFRKRSIPYRIYGGLSFYQRKEIKDLIAYFRLTLNPHDEEALKRIINYPARGIGATTVGKILSAATEQNRSLWDTIRRLPEDSLKFNRGTLGKLAAFARLLEDFIAYGSEADAYSLAEKVIRDTGILTEIYQDQSPENLSKQENIQELMGGLRNFCDNRYEETGEMPRIGDFLSEVALLTDQDTSDDESETPKVTLMTIHAAKGLEFRNVFIVGLEEELFPSQMAGMSPRAIEEERRLFYVAITRAMEHCCLSYARSRFRYGRTEFSNPSRFLADIDPAFLVPHIPGEEDTYRPRPTTPFRSLRNTQAAARASSENPSPIPTPPTGFGQWKKISPISANTGSASSPSALQAPKNSAANAKAGGSLAPGQQVEHERFGIGEVIRMEGEGENAKATILFKSCGQKQLLLRFARIKVL